MEIDYYLLLDHLYIYYYFFILAFYYPIPALNKAPYHRHDGVKTSPRYRQDITITRRRIAEGSPTVADSKRTSLTASRYSAE